LKSRQKSFSTLLPGNLVIGDAVELFFQIGGEIIST